MVECPICAKQVLEQRINAHIDSGCVSDVATEAQGALEDAHDADAANSSPHQPGPSAFFAPRSTQPARQEIRSPYSRREVASSQPLSTYSSNRTALQSHADGPAAPAWANAAAKRSFSSTTDDLRDDSHTQPKRTKTVTALEKAQPLAERMRPKTLDDVCGQELVGSDGVLRGLIETDRVPSMILWGGPGTGKTTIARLIARTAGTRFVEINSTSTGVGECKKLFAEAKSELTLTGRKTIIFCDEIHRFSKSQQDVFLGPVEAGQVTLVGATTENPSFKVINALLSRCRVFTLAKLSAQDIKKILHRALHQVQGSTQVTGEDGIGVSQAETEDASPGIDQTTSSKPTLLGEELLAYLAAFADGDARTALNLLELAMDLSSRPDMTLERLKGQLVHTMVYDRAGDLHYDTISAFHKSVRGSDPDAALYYLARMIQSGEDALYIARRMVVIASEDVGLADNSMLSLATATYTAAEKIGLPEARINLAHCAVALALAPKSTRAYRGLSNAAAALQEPESAGLPIPLHLRNAPTRLMREIGYGKDYKYNPNYVNGEVVQDYLPDSLKHRRFLEDRDLGTEVDPDLEKLRQKSRSTEPQAPDDEDDDDGDDQASSPSVEDRDPESSFVIGDGNVEQYIE